MKHSLTLPRLGGLILIAVVFSLAAFSQNSTSLRGPILGFLPDTRDGSIRPILGIPGAALVGHPIALDVPIRVAAVSPAQDSALAVLDASPDTVSLIRFAADTFERIDLPDVDPGIDIIVFSPTGTAAVVHDQETGLLQSLLLKPTPQVVFKFDASALGGRVVGIAAADSGRFAVIQAEGRSETWVVNSQKEHVLVPVRRSSAIAFVPENDEFLVADGEAGQIARVSQLETMRSDGLHVVPTLTAAELVGLVHIATSRDGLRLFGLTESGHTVLMDASSGATHSIPCSCKASGLYPLKGRTVFRLSNPEDGPITVLDARGDLAAARVVLIPAEVAP